MYILFEIIFPPIAFVGFPTSSWQLSRAKEKQDKASTVVQLLPYINKKSLLVLCLILGGKDYCGRKMVCSCNSN